MGKVDGSNVFDNAESVEFAGKAVSKLTEDPKRIEKTGKILMTCDLAREYGFTDDDGDIHDVRALGELLRKRGYNWLPSIIPSFVQIFAFHFHSVHQKIKLFKCFILAPLCAAYRELCARKLETKSYE